MTTEDEFQASLDENPLNWQTRLIFADWLQERDDCRATGYRALGVQQLCPSEDEDNPIWNYASPLRYLRRSEFAYPVPKWCVLPDDWFRAVAPASYTYWTFDRPSRREAENMAARGFRYLAAGRQALLLEGVLS